MVEALVISSGVFSNNKNIPKKYTCQGEDINPPLKVEGIPSQAKSLALIVDDPDAPGGMFIHWVVFNIPVTKEIYENSSPGVEGINDFGKTTYGGPCPPSGIHRYFFKVYALDSTLEIPKGISKMGLLLTMKSHILAQGELIGLYKKN